MNIYRRWAIGTGLLFTVALAMLITVGCEKIPEHIMNSPPARQEVLPAPDPSDPPTASPSLPQRRPPRDLIAATDATPVHTTGYRPESDARLENAAAEALARLGEPSLPALVEQLQSADPSHRWRAADTLARMGPAAVDAAEALVGRLENVEEHAEVKLACARAIGQMGAALWPEPPQLVMAAPSLEPLPAVNDDKITNPELSALRLRQQTRRIEYDELSQRRQQQYYQLQQEYEHRRAVAQRAVKALAALAISS